MRRDALVARPGKDGKTWWHKVGSAWDGEKGTTVFLDSLPLPDKDGKVSFILREPKPKDGQSASARDDMSQDIPF